MSRVASLVRSLGVGALLVAGAPFLVAQTSSSPASAAANAPVSLVCEAPPSLCEHDAALWALGHQYKARFTAAGYELTPALGARAPLACPVSFELLAVGRGQADRNVLPGQRRHAGLRVEYAHGDVTARYDVRREGIEQSFVFDRLPPGRGDLVVRGRFETALTVTTAGDGLRLELPDVGGLYIGGVTGVDAKGDRVAGTLRYQQGVLELVLPAAFVDRVALPLVIDPLIGNVFQAFSGNLDDRQPDVAYDLDTDSWLVVYETVNSATDIDITGQRITGTGALLGARVGIELTGQNLGPRVANVRARDHFVVAWNRGGDVLVRTVSASTGAVGAVATVAGTADVEDSCDTGGEATLVDDEAVCVWRNETQDRVFAAQITVSAGGSAVVSDTTSIWHSATQPPRLPSISKSGGSTGHHLIVFTYPVANPVANHDIGAVLVDRNLGELGSIPVVVGSPMPETLPAVDGDGRTWVIAWQEVVGNNAGVACSSVAWNPNDPIGLQVDYETARQYAAPVSNQVATLPTVVWTGGSAVVGFGLGQGCYVLPVDPFTCLGCETTNPALVAGSQAFDSDLEGCSKAAGGGVEDHALFVLTTSNGSTRDVQAQLWRSDDGQLADLGGACGADGGTNYATCARAGHAAFAARLRGAAPSAAAVFVLSRDRLGLPCGPCRLQPDPYTGVVVGALTDSGGDAQFAVAIPASPAVVGMTFLTQWLVAGPSTPDCYLFGADLSRALRITIE